MPAGYSTSFIPLSLLLLMPHIPVFLQDQQKKEHRINDFLSLESIEHDIFKLLQMRKA